MSWKQIAIALAVVFALMALAIGIAFLIPTNMM